MLSDTLPDTVNEIVQGVVAILLVGPIGAVVIIDAVLNRPFNAPEVLVALAGPVVGYYFSQRVQKRMQDQVADLTTKIVNGGQKQ